MTLMHPWTEVWKTTCLFTNTEENLLSFFTEAEKWFYRLKLSYFILAGFCEATDFIGLTL